MFRAGGARTRDIGRVAIGLGLMLIALSQLLEIITPYEDVPSLRILMGAIATDRLISVAVRRPARLGGSFERRGGAAGDVLRGKGRRAAQRRARADHRREHRHRAQSAARRRARRGCGADDASWSETSSPVSSARRSPCRCCTPIGVGLVQIEPELLARRRGLPHRVQPRHRAGVPAASRSSARASRTPDARARRPRRSRDVRSISTTPALETPSIALGHAAREALRMVDVLDSMIEAAADALRLRRPRGHRSRAHASTMCSTRSTARSSAT